MRKDHGCQTTCNSVFVDWESITKANDAISVGGVQSCLCDNGDYWALTTDMDIVLLCRIACAIYSLSHLWFRYPYRYFRHDGLFMQLIRSQSAAFIDRWYDRYSCSIYSKRLERMEISRSCAPLYSVADPGGKSGPGHLHPVWLYRFRSPIQRKK